MTFYTLTNKREISGKIIFFAGLFIIMILISSNVKCQSSGPIQPFGDEISAKQFYSSTVDDNNVVWFLTETGIVSFNGTDWTLHNENTKLSSKEIKDLDYDSSENGSGLWIATTDGAILIKSPVLTNSETAIYSPDNSGIIGKEIKDVAVSKKGMRWFATENGISAFKGGNWLKNNYQDLYPEDIFEYFPFSTMATGQNGDTLYVGTIGGGVMRFYKDDVDAVSGASEYAIWGPILIPSDTIYSVYITPDGAQWIGTSKGVAKHTGHNALEGWTIWDTDAGLANNRVQAINADANGKMYFGTKNGLSIFDGTNLINYKVEDGLISNNILTIAVDKNNVIWLGTDNGVTCLKNGEFISYQ